MPKRNGASAPSSDNGIDTRRCYKPLMAQAVKFDRPFSIALDLLRGGSALAVLIGHSAQLKLYAGPYPFSVALQCQAVTVFFVLSGLVIAKTAESRSGSLKDYAIARASRILPVAWPAVALCFCIAMAAVWAGAAPSPVNGGKATAGIDALMALAFMTESPWGDGFTANPPFWSLCYEVWFYALFGAATFLRGRARLAWLALLALIAGPAILLLLPSWLVGVWLARRLKGQKLPRARALIYVLVCLLTLYIMPSITVPVRDYLIGDTAMHIGESRNFVTDNLVAMAVGLGIVGLHSLAGSQARWLESIERPVRWLANMSFSLYLLHWPIIDLLRAIGIWHIQSPLVWGAVLVAIVGVCYLFALVTEHKRPAVRALLYALADGRRRAAASA